MCLVCLQDKQRVGLGQVVLQRGMRSEETREAHLVLKGIWILLRVTMVLLPCLESVWLLSGYGMCYSERPAMGVVLHPSEHSTMSKDIFGCHSLLGWVTECATGIW